MATKTEKPANAPQPVRMVALRKIDSAELGGAERVKRGAEFRAPSQAAADRLLAAGAARLP